MSLPLNEYRMVDLVKSGYNAEKSKPDNGEFVFDNPKYYLHLENGAVDKVTIAKEFGFVLKWGTKNSRDLERLKWKGWTFITIDDGIWPEPCDLDAEGHFTSFDAPLGKINTEHYVRTRKDEIAKSENALKAKKREMASFARDIEPGAAMSEEEIAEHLGS